MADAYSMGSMYATLGLRIKGVQQSQQTMYKFLQNLDVKITRINKRLDEMGVKAGQAGAAAAAGIQKPIPAMEETAKSLNQTSKAIFTSAQRWRTVGYLMSIVVTAPMVAAGKAAMETAKNFEFSMKKIEGLVGIPEDKVKELEKNIRKLAPKVAQTPSAIAEATYYVTSAGFKDVGQALGIVEIAAKAATAGLGDMTDIAKLLVFSMNAYKKSGINAVQVADIFTAAVREGAIEAEGFASSIQTVIPIASAMGVGIEQVSGAMAAMSLQGATAANSATYLRGMLNSLLKLKPGSGGGKALKEMGVSVDDLYAKLRQPGGLLKVLVQLQELSKQNSGNIFLKQIFRDIRAMTGALSLSGENLEYNEYIMNEVANAAGSMDKAFRVVTSSIQTRMDVLKAKMEEVKILFGKDFAEMFLPVLESLTNGLLKLTQAFDGLGDKTKGVIGTILAFAAAAGPLALLVSVLKYAYGGMVGTIFKWGKALFGVIPALRGNLVAMENLTTASAKLAKNLKALNTLRLNVGNAEFFKFLGMWGARGGAIGLAAGGVLLGAKALIKYQKEIRQAAEDSWLFNRAMVSVNGVLIKFNELTGGDILSMNVDEMKKAKEVARQVWEQAYNLYNQLDKNKESFGQSNALNNKQMKEQLEIINASRASYIQLDEAIRKYYKDQAAAEAAKKKAEEDARLKKLTEEAQELADTWTKMMDELAQKETMAEVAKKTGKDFDLLAEKADVLLKYIETFSGTEFKLSYDSKQIQEILRMLKELGIDLTEAGIALKKFEGEVSSRFRNIELKSKIKLQVPEMSFDFNTAMLDHYTKAYEDYLDVLSTPQYDPEKGFVFVDPTKAQIDRLRTYALLMRQYQQAVDNATDREMIAMLNAEAEAFGTVGGKIEVVNYQLEASRRLLRSMLKDKMTGGYVDEAKIRKAVANIQQLQQALIDLQNYQEISYLKSMNDALHTADTGAALLSGTIEALETELDFLAKNTKLSAIEFSVMANQIQELKYLEMFASSLGDAFDEVFDSIIEGGENLGETLTGIFKNMLKQILSMIARAAIQQAIIQPLENSIKELMDKWKNTKIAGTSELLTTESPTIFTPRTSTFEVPDFGKALLDLLYRTPKFAKGGVVPEGYPNDTYPALLSSGEVVIPTAQAPFIQEMLDAPKYKDGTPGAKAGPAWLTSGEMVLPQNIFKDLEQKLKAQQDSKFANEGLMQQYNDAMKKWQQYLDARMMYENTIQALNDFVPLKTKDYFKVKDIEDGQVGIRHGTKVNKQILTELAKASAIEGAPLLEVLTTAMRESGIGYITSFSQMMKGVPRDEQTADQMWYRPQDVMQSWSSDVMSSVPKEYEQWRMRYTPVDKKDVLKTKRGYILDEPWEEKGYGNALKYGGEYLRYLESFNIDTTLYEPFRKELRLFMQKQGQAYNPGETERAERMAKDRDVILKNKDLYNYADSVYRANLPTGVGKPMMTGAVTQGMQAFVRLFNKKQKEKEYRPVTGEFKGGMYELPEVNIEEKSRYGELSKYLVGKYNERNKNKTWADANILGGLFEPIAMLPQIPQLAGGKLFTGKYQTPSEAYDLTGMKGMFADMVMDPMNIPVGGIAKSLTKASKLKIPVSLQRSVDKGNQWLVDWLEHPITKQKFETLIEEEKAAQIALGAHPVFAQSKWERILDRTEFPGEYMSILPEIEELTKYGRKYFRKTYLGEPFRSGVFANPASALSKSMPPESAAFVNPFLKDVWKAHSTTIHESTHALTNANKLLPKDIQEELRSVFYTEQELSQLKGSPLAKFEKEGLAYISNPTEVYARMMETRRIFNLVPENVFPTDVMEYMLDQIKRGKTPIHPDFGGLAKDPKKLRDLMLRLPMFTGGALFGGSIYNNDRNIPGFADGIVGVPNGYPNDTYPAMLSSGETVIPAPTSAIMFEDLVKAIKALMGSMEDMTKSLVPMVALNKKEVSKTEDLRSAKETGKMIVSAFSAVMREQTKDERGIKGVVSELTPSILNKMFEKQATEIGSVMQGFVKNGLGVGAAPGGTGLLSGVSQKAAAAIGQKTASQLSSKVGAQLTSMAGAGATGSVLGAAGELLSSAGAATAPKAGGMAALLSAVAPFAMPLMMLAMFVGSSGMLDKDRGIFAPMKLRNWKKKHGYGLAEGGIIPAGYPNDSFPAMLSSHEAVIPLDRIERQKTTVIAGDVRFEIEQDKLVGILKKAEKRNKIY